MRLPRRSWSGSRPLVVDQSVGIASAKKIGGPPPEADQPLADALAGSGSGHAFNEPILCNSTLFAPVAQWIERGSPKAGVGGSIPPRRTFFERMTNVKVQMSR